MRIKKVSRLLLNKKADSAVVSAVILAGVAIALGFAVLVWGQNLSQVYTKSYGDTTNSEIDKLKETLTVEYSQYNSASKSVRIFMLNSGKVADTKIQSVYVRNSTWTWVTSSPPTLKLFNGDPSPDQDLDISEEGYVDASLSPTALTAGRYYFVRIMTLRGTIVESEFVA